MLDCELTSGHLNSGLKCPLICGLKSPLFIGQNVRRVSFQELSSAENASPYTTTLILACSRLLLGHAGFTYPLIYTRKTWWDPNVQPNPAWRLHTLWVAHYTSAAQPWLPRDWDDFQIWQYTNKGDGASFGAEEIHIDLNRARCEFIYPDQPNPISELNASILFALTVSNAIPYELNFPASHPLTFASGLTVNPANADVHITLLA